MTAEILSGAAACGRVTAPLLSSRLREPSGRLRRDRSADRGTPEQQQRRRLLVGEGAPPEAAAAAITVLQARGLLTARQVQAGIGLARAYRLAVEQRPHLRAAALDGRAGSGGAPADEAELVAARRALPLLLKLLGAERSAVVELAVFDRLPETPRQLAEARAGLQRLVERR